MLHDEHLLFLQSTAAHELPFPCPFRVAVTAAEAQSHCTLAVTVVFPVSVNLQVFVSSPPLEQAPDHTAVRPLETLSVIAVPVATAPTWYYPPPR